MISIEGFSKSNRDDIIPKMFFSASLAMIFTLFVGMAAQFFDGIITSRFLGNDAYSGVSLFGPINGIFLMIASFIASGNQIICSGYIGEGKKEEANGVFTFSILIGMAAALVMMLLCAFVPRPLLAFCGVTQADKPVLYGHMLSYMRGYLFGIPALIAVQILGPIVVLNNGKQYFTLSAVVLCVTDVAGDLINALFLNGGTFGMGIATSISLTVQFVMLIVFLLRREGTSWFSLKAFHKREISELGKNGFPSLVQLLAVNLRDLSINRLNLLFAVSTAAIVARGIQYDFNMVLFCISVGIGNTMLSMASIYHSVSDGVGLKRVFTYGMKLTIKASVITGAVVFVLAPVIVGFYTSDPETVSLSSFAIRCMALSLLFDMTACVYMSFLQSIRRRKEVIFLNVMDRFVLPVGAAAVLALLFRSKGLLASIALGKVLLVGAVYLMLWKVNRHVPRTLEQFMLIPEDFGGTRGNLYGTIASMEDVMREVKRTEEFCLQQGASRKTAMRMSLFMEEMAGNIVQHGSDKQRESGGEYRLFVNEDRICLTLRDYNKAFDPTAWYQENQNSAPEVGTGIRLVMAMAEETYYFNAFNSNNLIIWLKMNAEPAKA